MAWRNQLQHELAAVGNFSTGRESLICSLGAQRVQLELVALDSLACAFERLAFSSAKLKGASIDQVRRTAEALAARVNYLLEPVQPIEIDSDRCVVQLRSVPPQKDDTKTSYYELLVEKSGEISLRRYEYVVGQGRTAIAAQVTREVLFRLVDDMAAVAG